MKNIIASIVLVAVGIIGGMSLMVASNVKYDTSNDYTMWQVGDLEVKPYTQQWSDITKPSDLQPALGGMQYGMNPENVTVTNLEVR